MPAFEDHFSANATAYAAYRPHYPPELFDYLASIVPSTETAWDCATGNGQAAVGLAAVFSRVIATDASAEQLEQAMQHPRVTYERCPAESSVVEPASVDLVSVAQAVHWFNREQFYLQARRALRPRGVVAVWCYGLLRVTPEVDELIDRLYRETLRGFWPRERRLVDEGYRSIEFPFDELPVPAMENRAEWLPADLFGYLRTWSGVARYVVSCGEDPIEENSGSLLEAWGDVTKSKSVRWPIHLRAGTI